MTSETSDKAVRIERLRAIVNEDHSRVADCDDPWIVLNLDRDAEWEAAAARYERYERFYRAENFQKLGDQELTRKALDVRRAVGRAIVEIQGAMESMSVDETGALSDLDPSARAMGDIYFRDGLTYLRLGDLDSALDCLQRAKEYDPTRGLLLAYYAYTLFRRRTTDPETVGEARTSMIQAAKMDPANPDVHVLVARFFLKIREVERAVRSIEMVRSIDPDHPKLEILDQRLQRARAHG